MKGISWEYARLKNSFKSEFALPIKGPGEDLSTTTHLARFRLKRSNSVWVAGEMEKALIITKSPGLSNFQSKPYKGIGSL